MNKCIASFSNPLGFDSVYIPWNAAIAKPTKGVVQARILVDPRTDS